MIMQITQAPILCGAFVTPFMKAFCCPASAPIQRALKIALLKMKLKIFLFATNVSTFFKTFLVAIKRILKAHSLSLSLSPFSHSLSLSLSLSRFL
jgi:hypothetical protein